MTVPKRWGVSILGRPVQRPRKENYTNNSLEMLDKEILLSLPHEKEHRYFSKIWQIQNLEWKYFFRPGRIKF